MTLDTGPATEAARPDSYAGRHVAETGAAVLGAPPALAQQSLATRTARGTLVTIAGQLSQIALQMTSVIVLARLLSPHDYGLYALVLLISGVGEIFRDFGLSSAAVQAKTLSSGQRSNLFWVNTGIGVVLMAVVCAGAPLFAAAFHQPQLTGIARVLSITFVINGMATQCRANLNRNMLFGKLAAADLCGQVAAVSVAIICAAAGARYWALVGSQIAQVLTILVLVVVFGRWLPGRPDRTATVRPFLRFGVNFVGTQLVNYASNNLDSITIGVRLGPTKLGIYNRAFQLLMNPLNQLRTPATTVALPVLSRLQDDLARARVYVRSGQIAIGYSIIPALAIGAGVARPLVLLLLGPKWSQTSTVFTLLAVAGTFQMLSFVGYWVYVSRGLTAELFRYSLMAFSIRALCIPVASIWGITGVAAGYALAPGLAWPLSLWWLQRKTDLPIADLMRGAVRILSVACLAGVGAHLASAATVADGLVVSIVAGCAAGAAAYAVAAVFARPIRDDLRLVVDMAGRVVSR